MVSPSYISEKTTNLLRNLLTMSSLTEVSTSTTTECQEKLLPEIKCEIAGITDPQIMVAAPSFSESEEDPLALPNIKTEQKEILEMVKQEVNNTDSEKSNNEYEELEHENSEKQLLDRLGTSSNIKEQCLAPVSMDRASRKRKHKDQDSDLILSKEIETESDETENLTNIREALISKDDTTKRSEMFLEIILDRKSVDQSENSYKEFSTDPLSDSHQECEEKFDVGEAKTTYHACNENGSVKNNHSSQIDVPDYIEISDQEVSQIMLNSPCKEAENLSGQFLIPKNVHEYGIRNSDEQISSVPNMSLYTSDSNLIKENGAISEVIINQESELSGDTFIQTVKTESIETVQNSETKRDHKKCPLCNEMFFECHLLGSHLLTHASTSKPYQCPLCNFSFFERLKLINHIKLHSGIHMFGCHICGETFVDELQLLEHHRRQVHHICHICKKSFSDIQELLDHTVNVHESVNIESSVTGNSQNLTDLPESEDCNTSGLQIQVTSVYSLQEHSTGNSSDESSDDDLLMPCYTEVVMSDEGGTYLSCSLCNDVFADRSLLTSHLITHASNICPYPCPVCEKTFQSKNYLEKHLRVHTGLRPFICHVCGNNFFKKGSLKRHVIRTHRLPQQLPPQHPQQFPYRCLICSTRFQDKTLLNNHVTQVHLNPPSEGLENINSYKPYPCLLCSTRFQNKILLNYHVTLVHLKPLSEGRENINSYKPQDSYSLQLFPHSCPICSTRFQDRTVLKNHITLVHLNPPSEGLENINSNKPQEPYSEEINKASTLPDVQKRIEFVDLT